MERVGWRANVEICPTCPRCGSSNTKFCYYNNYSSTQPRYFCKGCRRYWTKGGSIRNVPVGGGCRKTRRSLSINKPMATAIRNAAHDSSTHVLQSKACSGHNSSLAGGTHDHDQAASNNIDLARVYANFLNQKPPNPPDHDHDHQPESNVGVVGSSTFEFSSVETDHHQSSLRMGRLSASDHHQLMAAAAQESCGFVPSDDHRGSSAEAHLSDIGNAFYVCGLDSIEKQQVVMDHQLGVTNQSSSINYTLPPLPGEDRTVSELEMVTSLHATDQSSSSRLLPLPLEDYHQNQLDHQNDITPLFNISNYACRHISRS